MLLQYELAGNEAARRAGFRRLIWFPSALLRDVSLRDEREAEFFSKGMDNDWFSNDPVEEFASEVINRANAMIDHASPPTGGPSV